MPFQPKCAFYKSSSDSQLRQTEQLASAAVSPRKVIRLKPFPFRKQQTFSGWKVAAVCTMLAMVCLVFYTLKGNTVTTHRRLPGFECASPATIVHDMDLLNRVIDFSTNVMTKYTTFHNNYSKWQDIQKELDDIIYKSQSLSKVARRHAQTKNVGSTLKSRRETQVAETKKQMKKFVSENFPDCYDASVDEKRKLNHTGYFNQKIYALKSTKMQSLLEFFHKQTLIQKRQEHITTQLKVFNTVGATVKFAIKAAIGINGLVTFCTTFFADAAAMNADDNVITTTTTQATTQILVSNNITVEPLEEGQIPAFNEHVPKKSPTLSCAQEGFFSLKSAKHWFAPIAHVKDFTEYLRRDLMPKVQGCGLTPNERDEIWTLLASLKLNLQEEQTIYKDVNDNLIIKKEQAVGILDTEVRDTKNQTPVKRVYFEITPKFMPKTYKKKYISAAMKKIKSEYDLKKGSRTTICGNLRQSLHYLHTTITGAGTKIIGYAQFNQYLTVEHIAECALRIDDEDKVELKVFHVAPETSKTGKKWSTYKKEIENAEEAVTYDCLQTETKCIYGEYKKYDDEPVFKGINWELLTEPSHILKVHKVADDVKENKANIKKLTDKIMKEAEEKYMAFDRQLQAINPTAKIQSLLATFAAYKRRANEQLQSQGNAISRMYKALVDARVFEKIPIRPQKVLTSTGELERQDTLDAMKMKATINEVSCTKGKATKKDESTISRKRTKHILPGKNGPVLVSRQDSW